MASKIERFRANSDDNPNKPWKCNHDLETSSTVTPTKPLRCIQIENTAALEAVAEAVAEAAQSGSGIEGVTDVAAEAPKE